MIAPDTNSFNREAAAAYLSQIGPWTQPTHLAKAARRGDGPTFTENDAGEPVYQRDALVAYAVAETIRIKKRRAERRAAGR